jgi:hypothetical protein
MRRYDDAVAAATLRCDTNPSDVCDVIDMSLRCLRGAALAAGGDPLLGYSVPDAGTFTDAFGDQARTALEAGLSASHNPALRTSGRLIGAANLAGTVLTLGKLAIAYESCKPS